MDMCSLRIVSQIFNRCFLGAGPQKRFPAEAGGLRKRCEQPGWSVGGQGTELLSWKNH